MPLLLKELSESCVVIWSCLVRFETSSPGLLSFMPQATKDVLKFCWDIISRHAMSCLLHLHLIITFLFPKDLWCHKKTLFKTRGSCSPDMLLCYIWCQIPSNCSSLWNNLSFSGNLRLVKEDTHIQPNLFTWIRGRIIFATLKWRLRCMKNLNLVVDSRKVECMTLQSNNKKGFMHSF